MNGWEGKGEEGGANPLPVKLLIFWPLERKGERFWAAAPTTDKLFTGVSDINNKYKIVLSICDQAIFMK